MLVIGDLLISAPAFQFEFWVVATGLLPVALALAEVASKGAALGQKQRGVPHWTVGTAAIRWRERRTEALHASGTWKIVSKPAIRGLASSATMRVPRTHDAPFSGTTVDG
jgi:hypothetical protein